MARRALRATLYILHRARGRFPGSMRIATMKKQSVWLLATLAAVLVVGCANQKAPAEQAVAGAETALAAVRDDAQKYVPDQLQAVDAQLAALKDSLTKGDYKSVLTGAPTLNSAISSLKDAADAKKADTEAALAKAKDAWGPLSAEVPKMSTRSRAASRPCPSHTTCPRASPGTASPRPSRAWIRSSRCGVMPRTLPPRVTSRRPWARLRP